MKQIGFIVFTLFLAVSPLQAESLTFYEAAEQITSPESLADFLNHNFQHQEDRDIFGVADYWQSPDEFALNGRGDCEYFALYSERMLQSLSYEAYVVSLYGENGYAHTLTLFEEDGRINAINENELIKLDSKTLEEALEAIYPGWVWAAIAEERSHRGWSIQEIWKKLPTEDEPYSSNKH